MRSAKIKNDSIFGQQLFLDWDLYQLLGIDGPDGTDWRLSTDYLSERGFAFGTSYRYNLPRTFLPGPATGFFDAWGLSDRGLDTLGSDRVDLFPERDTRGRITLRHRQYLTPDWELWAELGMISDRNFLEQFFEREWDEEKDFTTALRLRHYRDNQLLDILGQP
ncbi:MAG: organic solvent tolerance protein OstA, partial [Pirellulaceae bacterium]